MNKSLFRRNLLRMLPTLMLAVAFITGSVQPIHAQSSNAASAQQTVTVTGQVVDETGEPIIGASVIVKDRNIGANTDFDGNFSLKCVPGNTLVVSFIGYANQEVRASSSPMKIVLKENSELLDEVVVVGYGTQKKATLTGAVTQVKGDEVLKGKATQNMASAMQGTIPGLTITRTSSRPGNEGTNIQLRGGISVNSVDPMIIIDGVEAYSWELSQINPNDVENISVLKDAAAAIYGTKAAGGVILITTKRGQEGKPTITYSGAVHANMVGKRYPVANGVEWANMLIQATENDQRYSADGQYNWWMWPEETWRSMANGEIVKDMVAGTWRVLDPYSDQFDAVYGTTWGQSHNLIINGGNERVKAMTSLGYAKDRSLIDVAYDGQTKYNFRSNVDYKINDIFSVSANVSYDKRITESPQQGVGNGLQDFYIFPIYNEYGQFYDTFGNNNLVAKMVEGGRSRNQEELFRLGGTLNVDLNKYVKGLSLQATANFRNRHHKQIQRQTHVTMYDWAGETTSSDGYPDYSLGTGSIKSQSGDSDCWVKNTLEESFYQTYNALINYSRDFGLNHVSIMAGLTGEKTRYEKYYQYRKGMTNDNLDDINLGDATTSEATGGRNEVGLISWIGRFNYDYKGTFLLEGLFRRDGSSKFDKGHRWDNFYGISGGVRLSEMEFMQKNRIFNNLKIRASYGETGSQSGIGNYDYLSTISTGTTIFGYDGTKVNTAWISGMTSNNRTWERVSTTNFGLDFATLNNRLSGTFEYYIRKNNDMLISVTYPQTLGASAPKGNFGGYQAKGWELSLVWNDRVGEVSYNVGLSLSDARTEVTKYEGAAAIAAGKNTIVEGKPINSIYVYRTNGYIQSMEEAESYTASVSGNGTLAPVWNTNNQLRPGCVKKVDLNGDGAITTADLDYYGDANPHYNFGINLGAQWKGFDFSAFIQGVADQNLIREGNIRGPWISGWMNQNKVYLTDCWREDNTNARFPIMSRISALNNWNYSYYNDINVMKVWYARMKNIVLGYTIPKSITQRASVQNLRLYVSADNLFEIQHVADHFDPENQSSTGQGKIDCFSRTVSFGIDLTF